MDQDNPDDSVTLTFRFQNLLDQVSFSLYDVDLGTGSSNFTDEVTITGFDGSTNIFPTLTASTGATVGGTNSNVATGTSSVSNTSSNPNVDVLFADPINTFSIVYTNSSDVSGNPTGQGYAISDIQAQAVPFEAETGAGLVVLGSYLGWKRLRRKKQLSLSKS